MEATVERRALVRWATALPLFWWMAAQGLLQKLMAAAGGPDENIYTRIGVKPIINARGTWTFIGGSLILPDVKTAMEEASRYFVDVIELQRAVGKRLAEISGAESGMVTAGAAAAMAAATAACIAGSDPKSIWQLPDTTGMRNEVVMCGGRMPFDSAIRLSGAKLVMANTPEEVRLAIGPKTAMVYTTEVGERLYQVLEISKTANVPLLLDDAAGIPPFENLRLYAQLGVDLYTFSGGKGLRGPQCAGLLLGRKDLIDAALAHCSPWEGAICRPMKVGKEEIMGMLAAMEVWAKADLKSQLEQWAARVRRIAKFVNTVPGVKSDIFVPQLANRYPTLDVSWDGQAFRFTAADCYRELRNGEPRIEVLIRNNPSLVQGIDWDDSKTLPGENTVRIVSMTLQPGEDLVVGQRLRYVLNEARRRRV